MEKCAYPDTVYSLLDSKYCQQIYPAFFIFSDCINNIIQNMQIFQSTEFIDTKWRINMNNMKCMKNIDGNKIYLKINDNILYDKIEKNDNILYISINPNNYMIEYELNIMLALNFLKETNLYLDIDIIDNYIFFDQNDLYEIPKYIINFFNKIIAITNLDIQILLDDKYDIIYYLYAMIFINMFNPACISDKYIIYMYMLAAEYLNKNIKTDINDINYKYEVYKNFYNCIIEKFSLYFNKIKERIFLDSDKIYL